MKRRASNIGLVLCAVLGALTVTGCGAKTANDMVTETGNPPFVDSGAVGVTISGGKAKVVGQKGAVPAGAKITVSNARTGKNANATADDDGAFSASVPAKAGDTIDVSVSQGGASKVIHLGTEAADDGGVPDDVSDDVPDDVADDDSTSVGDTGDAGQDTNGTTPDNTDTNPGGTCEDKLASFSDALGAFTDGLDRSCEVDADCMPTEPSFSCYNWGCGFYTAVNTSTAAEIDTRARALDAQCTAFEADGCEPPPIPPCTPPAQGSHCEAGQCEMGPGSNVGPVAQSCDQLSSSAATTRSDGIAELDQTCTTNADCTVVDASLSCTACTYDIAVSINASADLQTLLSNIEAGACQSFSDMDCVLLQPPCTSAPNPRGVCQFAPAVPGGDTAASGVCTLVVGEDACRAESTDALQLVFSALDEAAQGCESVADCEEIPEPHVSCTQDDGACGAKAAIATIHKQAFEERLTEIEGSCTEFNQSNCTLDDNCPPTTPALELACVEGVCTETSPGAAD